MFLENENIINSYLTLMSLASFLVFLVVQKISHSKYLRLLLDDDFDKPQAFHKMSIPRVGGLASVISLLLLFTTFKFFFNYNISAYLIFSLAFFILGFADDIKIQLKPITRLLLMVLIVIVPLIFLDIKIYLTGFKFLNEWLESLIFQYIFLTLCFLFIINGCNLTDGFNGLLIIHLIIVNSILLAISLGGQNDNFSYLLIGQIFIMFCFLVFNFPTPKMFMGDGGAYLFGAVTSLNTINTSLLNEQISPVFFAGLLSYLFFEVFFSFFRKLKSGLSPLRPDPNHFHMLLFKKIDNLGIKYSNSITSLTINIAFLILTIPLIFFKNNGIACKIWFLIFIVLYLLSYNFLKIKKENFYENN